MEALSKKVSKTYLKLKSLVTCQPFLFIFLFRNLSYPNKLEYFTNFEDALWDMYVAVTTANFPDVMYAVNENLDFKK